MIRLLIVDDHAIVRQGLEQLFAIVPDVEVIGTAADGNLAVAQVRALAPDVVLMDIGMPNLDGLDATRRILTVDPDVKIVILTSYGDESRIREAIRAGAVGYLFKDTAPEDVIKAVRAADAGDAPLDPRAGRVLLDQRRQGRQQEELSPREYEVLQMVRQGLPNKEIARRLDIAERTVKAHLTTVFHRIGVTDRVQAARWAEEHLPRQ